MKAYLTLLSLGLSLLVSVSSAKAEKLTLLLDWYINPNHGPIIIAKEEGLFDQAGLDVEIIAPSDPSLPPKMVAAGKADLAINYQTQLHLDRHAGLSIRRVGVLIDKSLNCLLTLEEGPVHDLADLKGKTIGYSVAGVDEALIDVILTKAGLTRGDVTLVNVNWSLSPSLMSGQVDAVIGVARNVEPNQMKFDGVASRCFALEDITGLDNDELIFIAGDMTTKKEAISSFLKAINQAAAMISENPDATWQTFSAYAPELNSELNKVVWQETLPYFARDSLALDEARYQAMEDFLAGHGLISEVWPVERFVLSLDH